MKIVRSKRKTITLVIDPQGELTVRAPLRTPKAAIEEVVEKHRGWIDKKQEEVRLRKAEAPPSEFEEGRMFWFLGEQYPLAVVERSTHALQLWNKRFTLRRDALAHAPTLFEAWYKSQAKARIVPRVLMLAAAHNLSMKSVRITSARTRWGSCSSKGGLSFSWRLVMAPLPTVDYVIVHELAHLRHPNHSKAFWAEVERMMPEYRERQRWLKDNGHRLGFGKVEIGD